MKILLIDDQKTNHLYMQLSLKPYGQAETAMNGQEGFEKFQAALAQGAPFDLIFCDMTMPVWTGERFLKEVRKFEKQNQISKPARIAILSSQRSHSSVEKAKEWGADYFLSKPLRKMELEAFIEEFFS